MDCDTRPASVGVRDKLGSVALPHYRLPKKFRDPREFLQRSIAPHRPDRSAGTAQKSNLYALHAHLHSRHATPQPLAT